MVGDGSAAIVRVWSVPNAPTGEGMRYEDEAGWVWKPVFGQSLYLTGEAPGVLRDGRVYPGECPTTRARPSPAPPKPKRGRFFEGATPRERWRR